MFCTFDDVAHDGHHVCGYLARKSPLSGSETPTSYEPPTPTDDLPAAKPTQSAARPRVWTVFLTAVTALFLSVVSQAVVGAALAGIMIANGSDPKELAEALIPKLMSPPVFIGMLVLGQLAIFTSATVAAKMSPVPIILRIGLVNLDVQRGHTSCSCLDQPYRSGLGVGAAYLMAELIEPDKSVEMLYEQMTNAWAIVFIVLIGLLPGFAEEILFRGYMQRRFIQRWGPVTGINSATSIMFGLFHVTPHGIALATIIGAWLGVLAYRTGSIWSGIFCHAAINSSWNVWQVGKQLWGLPETPPMTVSVIGIVLMIFFFDSRYGCWRPKSERRLIRRSRGIE